jgi:uncharacterized protein YjiS (DUF1127 family)
MLSYFRKLRTYRKTYNELARLTDRELNDIGLSRADINDVARDQAYGY